MLHKDRRNRIHANRHIEREELRPVTAIEPMLFMRTNCMTVFLQQ